MATELERLAVVFEANTKAYESAMKRMQQSTEQAVRGSTEAVGKLDKVLTSAGESAASFIKEFASATLAGVGIEKLFEFAKAAVESAHAITDLAEKTGLSTDKIQELGFGASQASISFEEMSHGLLTFSRNIGQAQMGTGKLLDLFNAQDISLKNADGSFKTLDQDLISFADAIKGATTQQEALAMITTAMGKGSDEWLNFLRGGSEGLQKFGEDARTAGAIVDKELIQRGAEFDRTWQRATTIAGAYIKSWALTAIDDAADVITAISNAMKVIAGTAKLPPGTAVGSVGGGTTPALTPAPLSNAGAKSDLDLSAISATSRRIAAEAARAQREHEAAVRRVAGAYKQLGDEMDKILNEERRLSDQVAFFGEQGLSAFEKLAQGGAKFSDVMREVATAIIHAALQASLLGQGPLAQLFGTNATAAGAGGLFGRLFGTVPSSTGVVARQGGGHVSAGRPYVVGEHGPELMVPGSSGYIVPHAGSGGGTQVHIHTEPGMRAETRQSMGPQGPSIQVMIRSAVRSELPGALSPVMKAQYGIAPSLRRRPG